MICQYYYPEPFRIKDICEELARRGHEVDVVTGTPNYPEGKIYPGYEKGMRSDEIIGGVNVHRCRIIPRKSGPFFRVLNYFSYPAEAKKYLRKTLAGKAESFDVVLVNQLSPVLMAVPALFYKKRTKTPVVLYCLDLWPESIVCGGIDTQSPIYKFFFRLSGNIYRQADKILVSSKNFKTRLSENFNLDAGKIKYLPQYAEGLFTCLPFKQPGDEINLLFAGNIGEAQSVDTIIRAAEKLVDSHVRFHIVGDGSDLKRIRKMAEGVDNVVFYGRQPVECMPDYYALADAMLVTLKDDPVLSLTLPGKVQSYMAAGKPIIGAINGETATIVREAECGYCGSAESVEELVDNIQRFVDSNDKALLGKNAYAYYEEHFSKANFMKTLENELA